MISNTPLAEDHGNRALPSISKAIPQNATLSSGFLEYKPIVHKVKGIPINRSLIKNVQRENSTVLNLKFSILKQTMNRYHTSAPRTEENFSQKKREITEFKQKTLERFPKFQNKLNGMRKSYDAKKIQERSLSSLFKHTELKPLKSRSVSVPRLQTGDPPLMTARSGISSQMRTTSPNRSPASGFMESTIGNFYSDQKMTARSNVECPLSKSDVTIVKPVSNHSATHISSPLIKASNIKCFLEPNTRAESLNNNKTLQLISSQELLVQSLNFNDLGAYDSKEAQDYVHSQRLNELDGYLAKLRDGQIIPIRSSRLKKQKNKPTILDAFEEKTEFVQPKRRVGSLLRSVSPTRPMMGAKRNIAFAQVANQPIQDTKPTEQNRHEENYHRMSIMSDVSNIDSPEMVREELLQAAILDPAIFEKDIAESEKLAERIKERVRKTEPPVHPLLLQIAMKKRFYNPGTTMKKLISQEQAELGVKRKRREIIKRFGQALRLLKKLKLTVREILMYKVFSVFPFEKRYSREFILAARGGDSRKVGMYLKDNKYLVYDFDHFHLTALHWAVKHSHLEIIEMLIEHGADLQAKDIVGRTPLYFAIINDNLDVLKILILNQAEPWSTNEINYNRLMKGRPLSKYYIRRCRQIHILLMMTPTKLREAVWQRESKSLFDSEARKARQYATDYDSDDSVSSI